MKNAKSIWLTSSVILIIIMIILGGYTRLTHSGLSIVEWAPVSGTIPPLSEDSWNLEFSKYQQSPEYKKINYGIRIEEFKSIFWVEYSHRLLGRIIGLVFLLPFLYFIFTKQLNYQEIRYFTFVLTLIGLQGAIGWLMVKSGLINQPNVSQYRLALHLIMACIILIFLTWKIIDREATKSKYAYFTLGLLLLQIASGAFVAGLKAGLIYNSFPLMDGELLPDGLLIMQPWYINLFENITMVQFIHRVLAAINLINLMIYCYKILDHSKKIAILLAIMVTLQFILGITTLILQVPLTLALMHQALAIILIITMVISLKTGKLHVKNL